MGSHSSDLSEIEWSEEKDSPKKSSSRRNPTNHEMPDASSKPNSKAEEENLNSKKAPYSPTELPK